VKWVSFFLKIRIFNPARTQVKESHSFSGDLLSLMLTLTYFLFLSLFPNHNLIGRLGAAGLASLGYESRSDTAVSTHLKKILNDGMQEAEHDVTPSKARKGSVSSQDEGGAAEAKGGSSRVRWSSEEEAALVKYSTLLTKEYRGESIPDFEAIVQKMYSHDNFPERTAVAARAHFSHL
jgi:hypothetical protein